MNAEEPSKELSREHLLAIVRDQQDHIERLRSMLWTAAGIDEDEPPLTEADIQSMLANASPESLEDLIAEAEAKYGDSAGA